MYDASGEMEKWWIVPSMRRSGCLSHVCAGDSSAALQGCLMLHDKLGQRRRLHSTRLGLPDGLPRLRFCSHGKKIPASEVAQPATSGTEFWQTQGAPCRNLTTQGHRYEDTAVHHVSSAGRKVLSDRGAILRARTVYLAPLNEVFVRGPVHTGARYRSQVPTNTQEPKHALLSGSRCRAF